MSISKSIKLICACSLGIDSKVAVSSFNEPMLTCTRIVTVLCNSSRSVNYDPSCIRNAESVCIVKFVIGGWMNTVFRLHAVSKKFFIGV